MAAELQAAVADGQRDSYDTRLNTRIPGELDQRLPAVLSRRPLAHVLADLLSRQLPTEAELAARLQQTGAGADDYHRFVRHRHGAERGPQPPPQAGHHHRAARLPAALGMDAGAVIFAVLGIALARLDRRAVTERAPGDGHGLRLAIVAAVATAWGAETSQDGRSA